MKGLSLHLESAGFGRVLAYLATIFVGLHVVLYAAGIRFETYPLVGYLHMLDLELLRTRLLESVWYLHIQPPLFNFFVGLVLKVSGEFSDAAFHAIYLLLGFALYAGLFFLQCFLRVSRVVSLVLSTVFLVSPPFILFEHWLFYTLPCTVLLVGSALFFREGLRRESVGAIAGFFATLFLLCAMRSMFHLLFYVLLLGVTTYLLRKRWKAVVIVGTIPLLLLVGLYAKNAYLFGQFSASSLMGKNLWVLTVGNMQYEQRKRLVAEGKLSELSLIARFNSTAYYPQRYVDVQGYESIPALRQVAKSSGPHNFNHLAHVGISRQYMDDAMYGLVHYPKTFVLSTLVSWFGYVKPQYKGSGANAEVLSLVMRTYDYAVYWKLPLDLRKHVGFAKTADNPGYLFLFVGLPFLLLYGLFVTARGGVEMHDRWTLVYICFCIFYVAVVGNTFDMSDTSRYRFMTDPFYVALGGVFIQRSLVNRLGIGPK